MKRVLFVCTGNSARSQMAEAILRFLSEGRFEVFSAGTNPGQSVNAFAIQVLQEKGISTDNLHPKDLRQFLNAEIDLVVTVCDNARQTCPHFPGAKRYEHWSLEDPAAFQGTQFETLQIFRRTCDEIERRIRSVILEE